MALVLGLLAPCIVGGQGVSATGTIAGRVLLDSDSGMAGAPAMNATVALVGTTTVVRSDRDGRFVLSNVAAGMRLLRVTATEFSAQTVSVTVVAGDTARVDIVLRSRHAPVVMAPIQTDAQSVDREMFQTRPNVGTLTLTATQLSSAPRVGERDVIRAVQLLPGVEARNDFNTGLNVRGGEADQNLILLDGHPLYNPFHLGGLFSTFMDATVGGIELITGAFPARYGGRLSSVLDVQSADDARLGIHGTADISALGATGRLTGLLNGGAGTWSFAARRTYADAATSIFTNNIFPYHFRDFHGRATYSLPADIRLAITGYLGRDVLDANLADFENDSSASRASEGRWAFNWGNRLIGASLERDVGRLRAEQRFSASGFSTTLDLGDGTLSQQNAIRDLRASGDVLLRTSNHDVSAGYDVAAYHTRYASGSSQTGTSDFDITQQGTAGGLWIDDVWRLSSRWLIEPGLRGDALTSRHYASLSPRLSVKYFVTPSLALTAAGGYVTQWLHSLAGDGPLRYFEIWMASDSLIPVASAWHGVAGIERRLRDAGSIRLEAYLKRYPRVMEANWSEDPSVRGDELFAAQGTSYGVDLLARWQPTTGVAGWLSYSYGMSRRWVDTLSWAPGHDRRHDLNVVASWKLARYQLGARFGLATGTPYTPIVGSVARREYDPSTDTWGSGSPILYVEPIGGARNTARFPITHRVDLDISREFRRRHSSWTPYISVANAYNAKNVLVYLYQFGTTPATRRAISQFPILPSAGLRVAF
ncbi:MAG TPA: TonB-dependent receptor [Gemmatimonadaceae bacterium]|nr:TonB-dependent receptor [Gemmatimonadaceae bacterium]